LNIAQAFELFQDSKLDFTLQPNGTICCIKVAPNFYLQKNNPKKTKLNDASFSNTLCFDLKNETSQRIDYQLDSFKIIQTVSLYLPTCVRTTTSKKAAGIVTIYYRGAREHLNKNAPSQSSSGRAVDWGHAYIGVKDLKTGETHFLDGWPDGKLEEGKQHFTWNHNVDKNRCDDHHAISFNIAAKQVIELKKRIENYKTACIDYKMIDFNCTDATTELLEKIGCYTVKEQSGTVFPASFANNLMKKLNERNICYELDGYRIK
jgi:hypothetical protein